VSSTLLQLYLVSSLRSLAKGPGFQAFHKEVSLVYFSTFKPINLTPGSIMQQAGVPMLYDTASNQCLPCLYICPVVNKLGSFKDNWHLGSTANMQLALPRVAAEHSEALDMISYLIS
jgi:hypothetical protein